MVLFGNVLTSRSIGISKYTDLYGQTLVDCPTVYFVHRPRQNDILGVPSESVDETPSSNTVRCSTGRVERP